MPKGEGIYSLRYWVDKQRQKYKEETGRDQIVLVVPNTRPEESVKNIWMLLGEEVSPWHSTYRVYGSLLPGERRPNPRVNPKPHKRKYKTEEEIQEFVYRTRAGKKIEKQ